jgi:hypothetical protein
VFEVFQGIQDLVDQYAPELKKLNIEESQTRTRLVNGHPATWLMDGFTPIARHELASDDSTGSERAIDVQINRLRRKIETDPTNPVYLQTVRGKGYILYTD